MHRRRFLMSLTATAVLGGLKPVAARAATLTALQPEARLRELETAAQGRLGVHVLDTASGQEYGYRSDERFMMLSSHKLLSSALVLHRVDLGQESLARRIPYGAKDLLSWSPVTALHADGAGLSLAQLCAAAITTSDNTAANLILSASGGPAALTAYARELGDNMTRLDRMEPELNVKTADALQDTTTPRAMLMTMQKVVLGNALSVASRQQLQQWLLNNTTGGKRLRAGVPSDWQVAEKTGTNNTEVNDIGVLWPPRRAPVLVTAYLEDSQAGNEQKEATLAAVAKLVHDSLV